MVVHAPARERAQPSCDVLRPHVSHEQGMSVSEVKKHSAHVDRDADTPDHVLAHDGPERLANVAGVGGVPRHVTQQEGVSSVRKRTLAQSCVCSTRQTEALKFEVGTAYSRSKFRGSFDTVKQEASACEHTLLNSLQIGAQQLELGGVHLAVAVHVPYLQQRDRVRCAAE